MSGLAQPRQDHFRHPPLQLPVGAHLGFEGQQGQRHGVNRLHRLPTAGSGVVKTDRRLVRRRNILERCTVPGPGHRMAKIPGGKPGLAVGVDTDPNRMAAEGKDRTGHRTDRLRERGGPSAVPVGPQGIIALVLKGDDPPPDFWIDLVRVDGGQKAGQFAHGHAGLLLRTPSGRCCDFHNTPPFMVRFQFGELACPVQPHPLHDGFHGGVGFALVLDDEQAVAVELERDWRLRGGVHVRAPLEVVSGARTVSKRAYSGGWKPHQGLGRPVLASRLGHAGRPRSLALRGVAGTKKPPGLSGAVVRPWFWRFPSSASKTTPTALLLQVEKRCATRNTGPDPESR